MIFHRVSDDWVTAITGPLRADVCRTLRSLDLARLQKYPPPKLVGLKFGNETRVLRRFLQGRSSTLDASALSSWYRTFASARDRLLYRAFRQNDALTRDEWTTILAEGADAWQRHHLLAADGDRWRCRFSVVAIDGVLYVVDPLNDHGGPHQTVALNLASNGGDPDLQQFNHVYIGQDSLRMIEFMAPESYPAEVFAEVRRMWEAPMMGAMTLPNKIASYAEIKAVKKAAASMVPETELEKRKQVAKAADDLVKVLTRETILSGRRLDGREFAQIRPITSEVGILPRTHGSALFTRGETQALVTATLGTSDDAQIIEEYEGESEHTFLLHYNFPPFSVGETKFMRGPSRRDTRAPAGPCWPRGSRRSACSRPVPTSAGWW